MRRSSSPLIRPDKTALRRYKLSVPLRLTLDHGILVAGDTYGDVGCGHGDDCQFLSMYHGVAAQGEDKYLRQTFISSPVDVVGLIYVLNTDPDPSSRRSVLERAFSLAKRTLIVAVRTRQPRDLICQPYGDGVVTRRNTFQKFYSDQELEQYVGDVLAYRLHRVTAGIGFVFKDPEAAARYQARKQSTERTQNAASVKKAITQMLAGMRAKAPGGSPSIRRAGRSHG